MTRGQHPPSPPRFSLLGRTLVFLRGWEGTWEIHETATSRGWLPPLFATASHHVSWLEIGWIRCRARQSTGWSPSCSIAKRERRILRLIIASRLPSAHRGKDQDNPTNSTDPTGRFLVPLLVGASSVGRNGCDCRPAWANPAVTGAVSGCAGAAAGLAFTGPLAAATGCVVGGIASFLTVELTD
jgi:hypothetical protein